MKKKKVIMVIGAPGIGKTELAKKLAKIYKGILTFVEDPILKVVQKNQFKDTTTQELQYKIVKSVYNKIIKASQKTDKNIIIDGSPVCAYLFGSIYNANSKKLDQFIKDTEELREWIFYDLELITIVLRDKNRSDSRNRKIRAREWEKNEESKFEEIHKQFDKFNEFVDEKNLEGLTGKIIYVDNYDYVLSELHTTMLIDQILGKEE